MRQGVDCRKPLVACRHAAPAGILQVLQELPRVFGSEMIETAANLGSSRPWAARLLGFAFHPMPAGFALRWSIRPITQAEFGAFSFVGLHSNDQPKPVHFSH
jgi:hypothetical protein